jgi:hypothetical protein
MTNGELLAKLRSMAQGHRLCFRLGDAMFDREPRPSTVGEMAAELEPNRRDGTMHAGLAGRRISMDQFEPVAVAGPGPELEAALERGRRLLAEMESGAARQ